MNDVWFAPAVAPEGVLERGLVEELAQTLRPTSRAVAPSYLKLLV